MRMLPAGGTDASYVFAGVDAVARALGHETRVVVGDGGVLITAGDFDSFATRVGRTLPAMEADLKRIAVIDEAIDRLRGEPVSAHGLDAVPDDIERCRPLYRTPVASHATHGAGGRGGGSRHRPAGRSAARGRAGASRPSATARPQSHSPLPGTIAMIPGSYGFRANVGRLKLAALGAGAPPALFADTIALSITTATMTAAIAIGFCLAFAVPFQTRLARTTEHGR